MSEPADGLGAGTNTPRLDPRVEQARARQAIAEARRAEVDALLPAIPADIPTPTVTTPDTASPFAGLAAQKALITVVTSIATRIHQDIADKSVWIVVEDENVRFGAVRDGLLLQLDRLEDAVDAAGRALDKICGPDDAVSTQALASVPLVAGALSLVASAIGPLTTLLRPNKKIAHGEVTIDDRALVAALANHISLLGDAPPRAQIVTSASPPQPGPLTERVTRLRGRRDQLASRLVDCPAATIEEADPSWAKAMERLATLRAQRTWILRENGSGDLNDLGDRIDSAAAELAEHRRRVHRASTTSALVTGVIDAVDIFLDAVTTPGPDGLAALGAAEMYEQHAAHQGARTLSVRVTFSGAESVYTDPGARRSKVRHAGAVSVAFMLIDPDGQVVRSAVVPAVAHSEDPTPKGPAQMPTWLAFSS